MAGGPPENFGEKQGDMVRMVAAHLGEDRSKNRVVLDALVETAHQTIQGRHAAQPFEERGSAFVDHDKSYCVEAFLPAAWNANPRPRLQCSVCQLPAV